LLLGREHADTLNGEIFFGLRVLESNNEIVSGPKWAPLGGSALGGLAARGFAIDKLLTAENRLRMAR
jgi:hypothetical protein